MARHLTTTVRSVRSLTPDVTLYELADPDDWRLPPFKAGAHIDVHLPNGMTRSYSLCSDPAQAKRWAIAVRRETPGRGGSIYCHEHVREGMTLPVSLPRNHFPLAADAGRHLFLAAGIGVTPFMAMISELERDGRDFHLHMASRELASLAFAERMAQLQAAGRATIHLSGGDPARRMPISAIVAAAAGDPQTHLYACGPESFLADFLTAANGLPEARVHCERFNSPAAAAAKGAIASFEIELARSGQRLVVEAGSTILAALRRAGISVHASCEGGVCGACKVGVLGGEPDHRDFVLQPAERGSAMMVCVSGSKSPHLVLDL